MTGNGGRAARSEPHVQVLHGLIALNEGLRRSYVTLFTLHPRTSTGFPFCVRTTTSSPSTSRPISGIDTRLRACGKPLCSRWRSAL